MTPTKAKTETQSNGLIWKIPLWAITVAALGLAAAWGTQKAKIATLETGVHDNKDCIGVLQADVSGLKERTAAFDANQKIIMKRLESIDTNTEKIWEAMREEHRGRTQ